MGTLKADTIVASDGTSPVTLTKQSAAKAFADFNTTSNDTVEESLNISSKTDQATGDHVMNLANNMGSSNFAVSYDCQSNAIGSNYIFVGTVRNGAYKTSSSANLINSYDVTTTVGNDADHQSFVVHGDLA